MADRNRTDRSRRTYRDDDYRGWRQAEQFQEAGYDQGGDYDQGNRRQMDDDRDYRPRNFHYEEAAIIPRHRGVSRSGGRGHDPRETNQSRGGDYDEYGDSGRSYGASRYGTSGRGFQPFTSEDQGGRDFVRGGRQTYGGGYSDYGTRGYGGSSGSSYGDRGRDERGFFDKAGDEVASWFGDEDAARRRDMDHRGRGPGHYTRSDERILEDACDSLTDDWRVDARNIQVTVKDGEVTLDGTVDDRGAKRRAEDCVDHLSGVKHVQNNLRVQDRDAENNRNPRRTDS